MPLTDGGLHVDDTLVATATEHQRVIALALDERSIDEDVNLIQELPLSRHVDECLKREARIAPDIFISTLMDGSRQLSKALRLVHRITSREGDVGIGVGLDDAHDIIRRHRMTTLKVPRLRIMTTLALVTAASTVDGGPEARTIHHRILYD